MMISIIHDDDSYIWSSTAHLRPDQFSGKESEEAALYFAVISLYHPAADFFAGSSTAHLPVLVNQFLERIAGYVVQAALVIQPTCVLINFGGKNPRLEVIHRSANLCYILLHLGE